MEEGVWACYAVTKICANSQLSWRNLKQWQLNDAFHVVFAAGPRLCWGFPVEQPATLIQIK